MTHCMSVTLTLGALLPALALCARPAPGADAPLNPEDATYTLLLDKALDGTKPLTLHLDRKGGAFRLAFATAKGFNVVSHEVDATGLKLEGGALKGGVKVTVFSDGYVPKGRATVPCTYELNAKLAGPEVSGTFTGKYGDTEVRGATSGRLTPRVDAGAGQVSLTLENAVAAKQAGRARRLLLHFGLKDGQAVAGRTESGGGAQHALFGSKLEAMDLKCSDGRLTGTLRVSVTGAKEGAGTYDFVLDGAVLGAIAAGGLTAKIDGKDKEAGRFLGTAEQGPAADPREGVYLVTMNGVFGEGKPLNLYFRAIQGQFAFGFGMSPGYNYAVHDLDFSGLKLDDGALKGDLKVTVQPDTWVPPDHQPVTCVFAIDARAADAVVDGKFSGKFRDQEVKGAFAGQVSPPPQAKAVVSLYLNIQNGLHGGGGYKSRAFLGIKLTDGKVTGGGVSNNHTDVEGKLTGGEVKVEGDAVRGEVTVAIQKGGVWPGEYKFKFDGHLLAGMFGGNFESRIKSPQGEDSVKKGKFTGGYKLEGEGGAVLKDTQPAP